VAAHVNFETLERAVEISDSATRRLGRRWL
jgi:hypothetical protein